MLYGNAENSIESVSTMTSGQPQDKSVLFTASLLEATGRSKYAWVRCPIFWLDSCKPYLVSLPVPLPMGRSCRTCPFDFEIRFTKVGVCVLEGEGGKAGDSGNDRGKGH